jgi:uncharacterized protein with HEPN domain
VATTSVSTTSSKRQARSALSSSPAETPGTATGVRQLAVERLLEIIGESARAMTADTRALYPEIPWSDVIGLRTVLAHHYHRIDSDQVWTIAVIDIPALLDQLKNPRQD